MINQGQILQYLSANKQIISRKYHLKKMGIFGSYARNEQTPNSDLDLLIEFEDNTPHLTEKMSFYEKSYNRYLISLWIFAGKNTSNRYSVDTF